MKYLLVFIDGTICDTRMRNHLFGFPDFFADELVLADRPVPGSVECLNALSSRYGIVYIGARPECQRTITVQWLERNGFPAGELCLAPEHDERMRIVRSLKSRHVFVAGIGDRWDDNELHLELKCYSVILKEYEGNWNTALRFLLPVANQ